MATKYPRNPSILQKATIAYAFCKALSSGIWALILSPFRGKSGAPSISVHVKLATVRALLKNLTIAQSQFLLEPTDSVYPAYAQKKGFRPEFVTLKDGTKAYWLGNSKSEDILIWFHGGGWALAADPAHLTFASVIVENAKTAGKDLAVLFPSYTLAPYAQYPQQLQQVVETLRYALEELKLKPQNIFIGGDSAGGNLALGVLSHVLHPHPKISPLSLAAPLKGAVLLAPWVSFRTDWPSNNSNKNKDIITKTTGDSWSASYLGTAIKDEYNEPFERTDDQWWSRLQEIVGEIFVVGASDEVLLDSIQAMGKKLQAAHPKTTVLIAPNEFHDQCTTSFAGTPGKGQQADAIKNWITARV